MVNIINGIDTNIIYTCIYFDIMTMVSVLNKNTGVHYDINHNGNDCIT